MMKYFVGSKANFDEGICITSFCARGVLSVGFFLLLFGLAGCGGVEKQSGDNQPLNLDEKPEKLDANSSPVAQPSLAMELIRISMSDDGQVFLQGSQIEDGTDANMTRLADRLTTLITQRNALIDNKGMSIKDAALRVSVSLTGNRSGEVRFTYGKVLNVCKDAGMALVTLDDAGALLAQKEYVETFKDQ